MSTELIRQQSIKKNACCSGRPATEHFTNRVFGLPSHLFFPHHSALLQGLRAQLTPAQLPHYAYGLLLGLERHAQAVLGTSNKVPLPASSHVYMIPWGRAHTVERHQSIVGYGSHSVAWIAGCFFRSVCCAVLCCAVLCCAVLLP